MIYVLKLNSNKWYVGKTNNINSRLKQHISGNGSSWTQLYRMEKLVEQKDIKSPFDEDMTTLEYIAKYGIENVRGGSWSQVKLTEDQIINIGAMINSANNTCFKCNEPGHIAKYCKNKKEKEKEKEYMQIEIDLTVNSSEDSSSSDSAVMLAKQNVIEDLICFRCLRQHKTSECYAVRDINGLKPSKKVDWTKICDRCGRNHLTSKCYANKDIFGNIL